MVKPLLKKILQGAAYLAGPQRFHEGAPRLWVLMYHRVLPCDDDRFLAEEPGMVVTPKTFAMHLDEVRAYFTPMLLSEWVAKSQAGEALPSRCCAITFDDGWLDNYEYAFPLLEKHQMPATLFAVADKIGTQFQFWPNIIAHLVLKGKIAQLTQEPIFAALHAAIPSLGADRESCALAIKFLKRFSDEEIFRALDGLDWQNLVGPMKPALMSWSQLKQMYASGWVEIGSHTCSHRRLTDALDESQLCYEIKRSQQVLQDQLGSQVNVFCFPNGDYSSRALCLVKETYKAAVTTQRGVFRMGQNLHEISRIGLHEDVSSSPRAFGARLSTWI